MNNTNESTEIYVYYIHLYYAKIPWTSFPPIVNYEDIVCVAHKDMHRYIWKCL